MQETLHGAVLRIDKVLKRRGWQDRLDGPFAESEPVLSELRKAALLGRPMDDSVALQNKAQLRGLPTIRYLGALAPNAKLRPQVVQAGALAPRRRDKPQAVGHDCQALLSDAELAHHAVEQARQTSGRLAWSVAMRLAWKVDVLQCDCGGPRRLVAVIDQPTVIEKILAHLGLVTEALTKLEDPIWRVRGPPNELIPPDLDDAGLAVEEDGVDEEPGKPFFDELPADDGAA